MRQPAGDDEHDRRPRRQGQRHLGEHVQPVRVPVDGVSNARVRLSAVHRAGREDTRGESPSAPQGPGPGRSAISEWPPPSTCTTVAIGTGVDQRLRGRRRRHHVLLAEHEERGAAQRPGRVESAGVALHAAKSSGSTSGAVAPRDALHQPQVLPDIREARARIARLALEGGESTALCDQTLIMSIAAARRSRVAASSASDTRIGKAAATSATPRTRSAGGAPVRARSASPCCGRPAAAALAPLASACRRAARSAIASTLASAGPALRMWPGRSKASTLKP